MNNRFGKASVPFSSDALEVEVQAVANSKYIDVLLRLLDKFEKISTSDSEDFLRIYVALKIGRHHYKKHFRGGWLDLSWEDFAARMTLINEKILIARRNYYAAKQSGN